MPSSLLQIPRELRDQIIELVLYSPSQLTDGLLYPSNRVHLHDTKYSVLFCERVWYVKEPEWTIPAARALLLVSHQIAAETKAILSRCRVSYVLDVGIVQGRYLWPTWLAVPILSDRIDELTVNLRVFGSATSATRHYNAFRDTGSQTNGNPPPFASMLYSLLERILKRGPSFPSLENLTRLAETPEFQQHFRTEGLGKEELLSRIQSFVIVGENERVADKETRLENHRARGALGRVFEDRGIVIETLRLNCQTPPVWQGQWLSEPELGFEEWRSKAYYTSHAGDVPVVRPEWLASYISSELFSLLRLGYNDDWVAGIFYERIGFIQVMVDDIPITVFSLSHMLAGLQLTDPENLFNGYASMEERTLTFQEWKEGRLRLRRQNDFYDVNA
ncbi:hypothetical protein ASPSYDRAFT_49040 [Aspergillus sydowii CBS 593.65]|uniref:F-box domain-containing protein n=1 Tax=Aspergillus sydowii CBS 593.65 TaxID=1036612 RepID=A0A1L9T602_9EURO|nr:uncharacterized protein ASPSYDRAFT_49040 [Aspergillus sydowii CBS 593.65]OJJ54879.1 hypothetical protein ASPSYDRAFT_49040 [Aspergillus sydowii CBS 593.65]